MGKRPLICIPGRLEDGSDSAWFYADTRTPAPPPRIDREFSAWARSQPAFTRIQQLERELAAERRKHASTKRLCADLQRVNADYARLLDEEREDNT